MAVTVEELQILISAEVADALKGLKSVQRAVKEINEAAASPVRAANRAVKQAAEQVAAPIGRQQEALQESAKVQAQTAKEIDDAIKRMFEHQKSGYQEQAQEVVKAAQAPAKAVGEFTKAQQDAWAQYREGQAGLYDIDRDPAQLGVQKDIDAVISRLQARERAERELRAAIVQRAMADTQAARSGMTEKQKWIVDNPDKRGSEYKPAAMPQAAPIKTSLWNQVLQQYYAKLDYLKKKLGEIGLYGSEQVKAVSAATRQATAQTGKYAKAMGGVKNKASDTVKLHKQSLGYLAASARRVAVMSVLYGTLRTVTGGITEGLKNIALASKEANATMSSLATGALYLKNSIGAALLPVVQALTPAFDFLTGKLVSLFNMIGMLSARILGNATSYIMAKKAAVDYAQSVKGAQNQLAGFDELNVLTQKTPGMPDPGGMFEEVEIPGEVLGLADRVKAAFVGLKDVLTGFWDKYLKEPFTNAWGAIWPEFQEFGGILAGIGGDIMALGEPIRRVFDESVGPAIGRIIESLGGIAAGLMDTFNMLVADIWQMIYPLFESWIENIWPVAAELSAELIESVETFVEEAKALFDQVWREGAKPILDFAAGVLDDVMKLVKEKWDQYGAPLFEKYKELISNVFGILKNLWETVGKPIVDDVIRAAKDIWDNHLKPLLDSLMEFVAHLVDGAVTIYNEVIAPILNWLVDLLGPIVAEIVSGMITDFKNFAANVIDAINSVIKILTDIIDFVVAVFTGDWEKAWEAVENIFVDIWYGIKTAAGNAINFVKDKIEGLFDKISSLLDTVGRIGSSVGGWIGDKIDFVFSRFEAPAFATGAVVAEPTLAWTGEYAGAASNPEIIAPQSIMRETVVEANAPMVVALCAKLDSVIDAIERGGVEIGADGKGIFKVVQKEARNYKRATGVPAF